MQKTSNYLITHKRHKTNKQLHTQQVNRQMSLKKTLDAALLIGIIGTDPKFTSIADINITYALVLIFACTNIHHFIGFIKSARITRNGGEIYILTFPALALIASAWSSDPTAGLMIFIETSIVTFWAAVYSRKYTITEIVNIVLSSTLFVTLLSVLIIFIKPSIGLHQSGPDAGIAWAGMFHHKNSFSRCVLIAAICSTYLIIYTNRNKLLYTAITATLLLILHKTISATSFFALAYVILIAILVCHTNRPIIKKSILNLNFILPLLPLIMLSSSLVYEKTLTLIGRSTQQSTFGVRENLWLEIISDSLKKPILGYGTGGYWGSGKTLNVFEGSTLEWTADQAHNGFLELYISYGILGPLLISSMIVFYISRCKKIQPSLSKAEFFLASSSLSAFLILNSAYSSMFSQIALPWFFLSTIYLFIIKPRGKNAKS